MSIENRLRDVRYLYDGGRYEGALLSVLTAVSAASRLRHPTGSSGQAFKNFFDAEMERFGNCRVPVTPTRLVSVADFFYDWLRNPLAHQGALHPMIDFVPPSEPGEMVIAPELVSGRIAVTHTVVLFIGWAVATSADVQPMPADVVRAMSDY